MSAKQYIVVSASELNAGAGCWSNDLGWTTLDLATRFTEEEVGVLSLPLATHKDAIWLLLPADADSAYVTKATLFNQQVAHCVDCMLQDDACGEVMVFERMAGQLVPTTVSPDAIDLTHLSRYELILFDGGNTSGDRWKQIFHPQTLIAQFINENPIPQPKSQVLEVSLDGGQTYQPAPSGVRVIYKDVLIDGEDGKGEVHINATHEGLITDVWCLDHNGDDFNIGTESQQIDDIVTRLVGEND